MTDTKTEPNYQDILDKYAQSIKSTEEPDTLKPEPEPESVLEQKPEPLLDAELTPESELEIHPQIEIDNKNETELDLKEAENLNDISMPETPTTIETQPETPINFNLPPMPPVSLGEGEEAIAINSPEAPMEITPESTDVLPPKENHFFKYLFFFSLFIFIIILISVVVSFVNSQKTTGTITNQGVPTSVPPTAAPSNTCEINGQQYAIGENFKATDGCNSCSCSADLSIACTEMACEATPSVKLSPTKTATLSATKTPSKTPTIVELE